jgi:hypothetical protein
MAADNPEARRRAIAAYKALLREFIDRRPSGLRGRLARALGTHRSFVSQITSPAYDVPIPTAHLPVIFEVCHLAPEERRRFLELYEQAHPRGLKRLRTPASPPHEIRIALPPFARAKTALEVEATIREFAARVIRIAQTAEQAHADLEPGEDP